MATSTSGFENSSRFRIALVVGLVVGVWNLVLMLRAWLLTTQAEIIGATIFFLFLGLVPLVGLIASGRGSTVGPWILTISPLIALTGLFFIKINEPRDFVLPMLITVAPAVAVGLVLLRLSREQPVATIR